MSNSLYSVLKPIWWLVILLTLLSLEVNAEKVPPTNNQQPNLNIVSHIEPPFWWVGMQEDHLQLMLHGKNIAELTVKTANNHWKIESVERTDNRNYLFVNLMIPEEIKQGIYDIQLTQHGKTIHTIHYQLKIRKKDSRSRQGFNSSDTIYLITPDRFANGDTSNDEIKELKEKPNRADVDGRHGGDIQGIIDNLDYIAAMGFTQVWINPLLENDQTKTSYHGYSTTDYYEIDKRFGDNKLYRELSKKAREKGIGLIKDVILNHIGSEHWWMNDLPSKDWINNDAKFKPTTHRRETLQDPHGTAEDRKDFSQGWFVPSMPDLNQKNPLVANYIIQNNIWWIEYADLSGIRVDTFSYSDKGFLAEYVDRLMREYPAFNIVGEEWTTSPNIISYWQRGKQRHDNYKIELPSLMDFPLNDAVIKGLSEAENWSGGLRKLYEILAVDYVYAEPNNLVIFPDNHDMSRIYTQLEHDTALTKMAIAFYATTRGIPQFYYGTEILMQNPGTESHGVIRTDFPGGWKGDKQNAFSGFQLSREQKSMQEYIAKLLNWRKRTEVIHHGELTHYAPQKGVYVYFRHDNINKVMIVLNKNNTQIEINPKSYPSMLSADEKSTFGLDVIEQVKYPLNRTFSVQAKSVLILQL